MTTNLSKWRRIVFVLSTGVILAMGVIVFIDGRESEVGTITDEKNEEPVRSSGVIGDSEEAPTPSSDDSALRPEEKQVAESFSNASLPMTASISVPFLVQAPFANWDALHQDACEEASLIMLKHFLDNTPILSQADGDEEIKGMISYEEAGGYGGSVTLQELSKIAEGYYSMTGSRIANGFSIDDLKKEIAAGRPVIVPAAGKMLPNPNFRNGGPNYHMLVIKGYDEDEFITNDPGTRKGEGYRYKHEDLYRAVHDWDPQNILNGQRAYLVFD